MHDASNCCDDVMNAWLGKIKWRQIFSAKSLVSMAACIFRRRCRFARCILSFFGKAKSFLNSVDVERRKVLFVTELIHRSCLFRKENSWTTVFLLALIGCCHLAMESSGAYRRSPRRHTSTRSRTKTSSAALELSEKTTVAELRAELLSRGQTIPSGLKKIDLVSTMI